MNSAVVLQASSALCCFNTYVWGWGTHVYFTMCVGIRRQLVRDSCMYDVDGTLDTEGSFKEFPRLPIG